MVYDSLLGLKRRIVLSNAPVSCSTFITLMSVGYIRFVYLFIYLLIYLLAQLEVR